MRAGWALDQAGGLGLLGGRLCVAVLDLLERRQVEHEGVVAAAAVVVSADDERRLPIAAGVYLLAIGRADLSHVGAEHLQHRHETDHLREHRQESVILAEQDRGPQHRGPRKRREHPFFAELFGCGIFDFGLVVRLRGDGADMDEAGGAGGGGGFG
ncbi:hypothetical protein LCGC14_0799070, partial [marine sediment metagenome]